MPFEIPENAAVITSSFVTIDRQPIVEIAHQIDDEGGESIWQFHCGNRDFSPARMQLVTLKTILELDPTVVTASDLPPGFVAKRQDVGLQWTYEKESGQ